MPAKIEFSTANASFGDDSSGPDASEIAYCLEKIVKAYSEGASNGSVRDVNGNTIGQWSITSDKDEDDEITGWDEG